MWYDLDKPWQEALALAWEAYKNGTIPIGCVITSKDGRIISKGRNQIFDKTSENLLSGTNMAHAEMSALFGLREKDHPDIKSYILYTTMEPCPMCFGTIVMMGIRNVSYGARDGFAGATSLNDKLDYIYKKGIAIKGEEKIEAFQLILQSAYEYERNHPRVEEILGTWRAVNHLAIDCGKELYNKGYFPQAAKDNKEISAIYDDVMKIYLEQRTCPICGRDNDCQHNSTCWCFSATIPKGLLDKIPHDKRGRACVCKSCIDSYRG